MPRVIDPARIPDLVSAYENGDSLSKIAQREGMAVSTVRSKLVNAGIGIDGHRKATCRNVTDAQRNEMVERYTAGERGVDLLQAVGLPGRVDILYSTLRARGVPRRMPLAANTGRKLAAGSTSVTTDGYVVEKVDSSWPFIGKMGGHGDGSWILQHRKVMAEALNRPLLRWEQVHHIDGDKTNNDLSNLELRSGSHGSGVKLVCRCCGATDIEAVELD